MFIFQLIGKPCLKSKLLLTAYSKYCIVNELLYISDSILLIRQITWKKIDSDGHNLNTFH